MLNLCWGFPIRTETIVTRHLWNSTIKLILDVYDCNIFITNSAIEKKLDFVPTNMQIHLNKLYYLQTSQDSTTDHLSIPNQLRYSHSCNLVASSILWYTPSHSWLHKQILVVQVLITKKMNDQCSPQCSVMLKI